MANWSTSSCSNFWTTRDIELNFYQNVAIFICFKIIDTTIDIDCLDLGPKHAWLSTVVWLVCDLSPQWAKTWSQACLGVYLGSEWLQKAPKSQRLKSRAIAMMAIAISWGITDIYYKLLVQVIWFWIKRYGFEIEFTLVFLVHIRLIV